MNVAAFALPGAPEPIATAPHNLDAEQALLGAILFDNAAYERLSDRLQARHFHEPFHQRLFAAMEEHIRKGQLAEPIMLMERFRRDPAFDDLGGLRYLADMVDRAPPANRSSRPNSSSTVWRRAGRPPPASRPSPTRCRAQSR